MEEQNHFTAKIKCFIAISKMYPKINEILEKVNKILFTTVKCFLKSEYESEPSKEEISEYIDNNISTPNIFEISKYMNDEKFTSYIDKKEKDECLSIIETFQDKAKSDKYFATFIYNLDLFYSLFKKSYTKNFINYLEKNKDNLDKIINLLEKIESLGYEYIGFKFDSDFKDYEYHFDPNWIESVKDDIFSNQYCVSYLENMEVTSYSNKEISYKTTNSNYEIIYTYLSYKGELSVLSPEIVVSNLLFDSNLLIDPSSIDCYKFVYEIPNYKSKKKEYDDRKKLALLVASKKEISSTREYLNDRINFINSLLQNSTDNINSLKLANSIIKIDENFKTIIDICDEEINRICPNFLDSKLENNNDNNKHIEELLSFVLENFDEIPEIRHLLKDLITALVLNYNDDYLTNIVNSINKKIDETINGTYDKNSPFIPLAVTSRIKFKQTFNKIISSSSLVQEKTLIK